jgi:hypothetical protein
LLISSTTNARICGVTAIDLATFPCITDAQLRSLLERMNAESITQTFLFDKNPKHVITGSGLEPLRHSRVLESIDLRQCSDWTAGSTGLDDELVMDILSTVLPHELKSVNVRKQNDSGNVAFDQYCFPWSCFFANLCLFVRARKSVSRKLALIVTSHFRVKAISHQNKCWRGEQFNAHCERSTVVSRGTNLMCVLIFDNAESVSNGAVQPVAK